MLVITRRVGEVVKIGKVVSCVVLGVDGNQIKLGFDGPREIEIVREEAADDRDSGDKGRFKVVKG